jgi:hypothetical protein
MPVSVPLMSRNFWPLIVHGTDYVAGKPANAALI